MIENWAVQPDVNEFTPVCYIHWDRAMPSDISLAYTHKFFASLMMLETSDRKPFSNLDVWRQNENSDSGSARFLHSGTPASACSERPRQTSFGENISHHYLLASTNNAPAANWL